MIHSLYFITFILIILCVFKGIDLIIIDVKAEKNGTNSDRDVSAESEFKKIGQELPNLYYVEFQKPSAKQEARQI